MKAQQTSYTTFQHDSIFSSQRLHTIELARHSDIDSCPVQNSLSDWLKATTTRKAVNNAASSCFGIFSLGAILFSGPSVLIAPAAAATATQPNIVVIVTDDQTMEMMRALPKTLALIGAAGTTFSSYYASFPLCCPSRATFLTGQYPHNHGVIANGPPRGGYGKLDHTNTLAVWLQEAGYHTSHIGRYLNGYGKEHSTEIPPGWNDWQTLTSTHMYNYTINDNGRQVSYGERPQDYQTDVLANRAVRTIGEAVATQPYFLNIDVKAPHLESGAGFPNPRPAPRDLGAFDDEPSPLPPSFNEADVSDKPAKLSRLPRLTKRDIQKITARYHSQLASLLAVDDLVERVVNALAATRVLDNTVLIFTSDNGFFKGEHRIQLGKGYAYEEASHLPMLIRGGGFPAGITVNQPVATVDLAPTIVALAGASPRLVMDGQSMLPLAQNPSLAAARDVLIENVNYKALRNNAFLYVEHKTGERELYDMRSTTANYDPYQLESRDADPAYDPIESALATKLNTLQTCSGASCQVQ